MKSPKLTQPVNSRAGAELQQAGEPVLPGGRVTCVLLFLLGIAVFLSTSAFPLFVILLFLSYVIDSEWAAVQV